MKITLEKLQELKNNFSKDRANRVAQNAATTNGIFKASLHYDNNKTNLNEFNISLKKTKVADQKKSGRCWMFAALNVMRYKLMENYNLDDFKLSKNYTLFFDKLERANYFLNTILNTMDEEVNGRLLSHLMSTDLLSDGGQWDMLKNIINKYGLVPEYAMVESYNSSNTALLDEYLQKLLRNDAMELRRAHKNGKSSSELEKMVEAYVEEIFKVLCISLGTPPEKFDFECRDKDNKFISYKNISPQEFLKDHVKMNLDDYVSLINSPTKDKPFYKSYTVKYLGNVLEGHPVTYINLPIEELKKAVLNQLKDNEPVWFGCDVTQFLDRDNGRMDLTSVRVDDLFGIDFKMDKATRLDAHESLMTHAMVFMGLNYDEKENKIDRYKVENSWGEDAGCKGFYVMSDEWFDEYLYQVLINKKHLSKDILKALDEKPIELEPWDPMGSLAKFS
ncbi:C1 family peptidase [Peptoniphilus lacrimalis]|uniref:Aminopeptidase n=1 Tax=Peptoniphilus lacrimalis TaxID=33031 RepID=A0A379C2R2_9FIRM|nr:C1 family peptidase [Peptoniphilus lacrimalis]SUB56544.1 Aminopeptidase C [Peptoniphilus lacrimalis]